MKKVKTAQNTVPVHEFGPSPGCKKARRTEKTTCNFHHFFLKNRAKIEPKNRERQEKQRNRLKSFSGDPIFCQGRVSGRFLDLRGKPKLGLNPRGVLTKMTGLPKLYYFTCLNKARDQFPLNFDVVFGAPGRLPGQFLDPKLLIFGIVLRLSKLW